MKLRQRILLAIGVTTVALISGIYMLSNKLLLKSFKELEARESSRNVDRIRDAIKGQADDLHRGSIDWANWDDSYQFVIDKNKEFIDANLETMTLKLDQMLFLDTSGKIVYARQVQRTHGVQPPNPEEVRKALGFDKPGGIKDPLRAVGGLISIGGKVCFVSARPIQPSETNKAPRGWIVWTLYFDAAETKNLSTRSHLDFKLIPNSELEKTPEIKQAAAAIKQSIHTHSVSLSDQKIAGYGLVSDINGIPIALVRVIEPRSIYLQGLDSVSQLLLVIVLASLAFSLVFIALIDAFALRRITHLTQQIEMSANEQIGAKPICLTGKDELSWLAQKTQEMVSKLQSKGEELRLNHDRLQETVAKLASVNSVLEHAVEGIARLDSRDRIAATNGSFASNFGFRRGDMCERPWQSIIQPENHDVFAEAIKTAKSCGKSSIELIACRADKSLFHAEFVFIKSNRTGSDSEGLHIFMKDISERKSLETRIEHQAFHDSLTGLPNRAKFMDRLAHALTRAKRHGVGVSVLFLDLDNFKIINDSLGHEAGDQLLISIAERLKECLREEDTIARLGGDEFTVILEDINSVERAVEVANRIVTSLALPIQLEHCETVAMASIGISFCVGGSEPAEVLLREADTAMYVAKDRGKSGFALFDQSMNQEVVERMEIEMGLRQALERGDFVLEYQPIVSLMSGDVTGVEALIRWDHPERGRIPPDKFIAVAEECGMIVPIGAWVLQKACTDMLAPQFDGLLLSVNISGRQLQRPNFIEMVSETLVDSGFDPGRLQLEVTESVLIGDLSESIDKLHELKDLGVQIAIDDFGTGYSSLSTLNSYPVDVVKIDRSFICRMGEEDEVDAIVGAIVLLCKVLKLEVTAEGLETRQQVQYLQAFGCDTAQGYYFSRPLPLNQFAELMPNGLNLSIALEFRNQEIHNPMQAA